MSFGAKPAPTVSELKFSLDHHLSIIAVASDGAVRRNAATKLLREIGAFLDHWEKNAASAQVASQNFPSGILREALGRLLTHVGPGDSQLRSFLLQYLSRTMSSSCRQLLLDTLPSTMPALSTHSQTTKTSPEMEELESATRQVIDILRSVLSKDSSALLPVIGCLSGMPLSETGRKEAFQLALESLAYVSETELPTLITTLLRHADSEENVFLALETIRTELGLIESAERSTKENVDESITMVIHVTLNVLLDEENNNRIAKAYCRILQRLLENVSSSANGEEGRLDESSNLSLLLLDVAVLLVLCQHPDFTDIVEYTVDCMLKDDQFPFDKLAHLVLLVSGSKRRGRSILYRRMISSLVSFGIFLLLLPLRLSKHGLVGSAAPKTLDSIMKQTQDFLVHLHHLSDRDIQAEIVQSLLHLSHESATNKWEVGSISMRPKRYTTKRSRYRESSLVPPLQVLSSNGGNDDSDHQCFQILIDDTVNNTLKHLARTSKGSFANFKHILVGRLTNRSFQSPFWEQHCVKHLCAILSALFEPTVSRSMTSHDNSGGMQASEVMVLLQKLLFSSSFASVGGATRNSFSVDNRLVVRGLLLATELIKSPCLGRGDWDCVKEWVLKILLPSTRRMVDPEIGPPGLHFLEALMTVPAEDSELSPDSLKKSNFQHMKMVLANTGLVQILGQYQQQQQNHLSPAPILGYTAEPDDIFTSTAVSKHKKRRMVFCLAFFLRNSDLSPPQRWEQAVTWVHDLLDVYLRIGRDIAATSSMTRTNNKRAGKIPSSTWMPHGWLQAAIEYPPLSLPQAIKAKSKKGEIAMEWLQSQFADYEVRQVLGDESLPSQDIQKSLLDLLSNGEDDMQLRDIAESAFNLGLALCLNISLSLAVVKNSYAHLSTIVSPPDEEAHGDEREEIIRLIQYQMAKVFDAKERCKSLQILLSAVLSCVSKSLHKLKITRRRRRSQEYNEIDDDSQRNRSNSLPDEQRLTLEGDGSEETHTTRAAVADDGLGALQRLKEEIEFSIFQMKRILSQLFTSQNSLPSEILLDCLDEEKQSETVTKTLTSVIRSPPSATTSERSSMAHLVSVRKHLLKTLVATTGRKGPAFVVNECFHLHKRSRAPLSTRQFKLCLKSSVELVLMLPELRKSSAVDTQPGNLYRDIASLVAAYLQLTITALASCLEKDEANEGPAPSLSHYVGVCLDIFDSENVLQDCSKSATEKVLIGFLRLLQSCEHQGVADELLEIMSVIARFVGSELREQVVSASWKALHTVYSSSWGTAESFHSLPFALAVVLRQQKAALSSKASFFRMKVLRCTLLKGNAKAQTSIIRKNLLRHWALLTLTPEVAGTSIEHLLGVHEELSLVAESLGGCATVLDPGKEEKKDDKRIANGSGTSIPDLTDESFEVAFETMLDMTVASISIFALDNPAKSTIDLNTLSSKESGPYWQIESFLFLFSRLLELYEHNIHLFSKSTLTKIFAASRYLLSIIVLQVQACVNWRNAQPLLSMADKSKGRYDPGEMKYLQNLINACWIHTIVKMLTFCDAMPKQHHPVKQTSVSRRQKDSENSTGIESVQQPEFSRVLHSDSRARSFKLYNKVSSLRSSVEKTAQTLKTIAASHNLALPSSEDENKFEMQILPQKRKARKKEDVGFHELRKKSTEAGKVSENLRRQRKRLYVVEDNEDNSENFSSEHHKRPSRLRIGDEEPENLSEDDQDSRFLSSEDDDSLGCEGEGGQDFVAMGWGEDASDESSSGSLGLEIEGSLF